MGQCFTVCDACLVAWFSGLGAKTPRSEHIEDRMIDNAWHAAHTLTYVPGTTVEEPVRTYDAPWGPLVVPMRWSAEFQTCFDDAHKATNFAPDSPGSSTSHNAKERFRVEICKALLSSNTSGLGFQQQVSERSVKSSAPHA